MKKLILLLVFMTIGFSSCERDPKDYSQRINKTVETMFYFKDYKTGLCFAGIYNDNGYGDVISITCVPCDSLKKIGIK
jgi:hypothetical protein